MIRRVSRLAMAIALGLATPALAQPAAFTGALIHDGKLALDVPPKALVLLELR